MGRSESAYSFVGYGVRINDLLEQIHDKASFTNAYYTFLDSDVFLADENDTDNNLYYTIMENLELDEDGPWQENKQILLTKMVRLLDHTLLIPVIPLASNTRWGYNREGVHGGYEIVSNDFSERLSDLYENCPLSHTVVWIVRQSGG
jgi:hypothetical protein